jgi:iron complex outermembrane receptor protein
MRFSRLLPSLLLPALLLWAAPGSAQNATGTVTGRVVDAASQQPLAGAAVVVAGHGGTSGPDGRFSVSGVPAGVQTLRVTHVGYGESTQSVTVADGQTADVEVRLSAQAVQLEELVAVGYGTTRREAITGAVSTVDADVANKGVITNANQMLQGRVAGVQIVQNSGEPGAAAQIRIRGGTSISASNEPLYVVDGVPIENQPTEPGGIGIGGSAPLARSALNLLNPADIESITVLKDAASTAIYGARAANGVVLIQTRKGRAGSQIDYDGYVGVSTPSNYLDVLNGNQYRQFIQQQVAAGELPADRLDNLGDANTNWERELTRTAYTQNHNLSFTGGNAATRYRASLNYMDQQGVVINNGFRRVQGRLNGTTNALDNRFRLDLNLTGSRIDNDYLPYENSGGFEGGVFTNMVIFNPTEPIMVVDPDTKVERFYEVGAGSQSVRNPVALARQISDQGNTTRLLGNATAQLDLLSWLTGEVLVGADHSSGIRNIYFPLASPVGAATNGLANDANQSINNTTFHGLLTAAPELGDVGLNVVGGYEFNQYTTTGFGAQTQGYITDAFRYYNLGGGNNVQVPYSFRTDSRIVSFFSRATASYKDRYYLNGSLRYDGGSVFGAGNKWALFPAISASWRLSEESFMQGGVFSDLRLRAGYGVTGNPAVPPYESLILLGTDQGFRTVWGNQVVTGVAPTHNPNPNLKWEQTSQWDVGLDYGLADNRFTGALDFYVKDTDDLLLRVVVPQPALVSDRLENIGSIRNKGVEFSLDALAVDRPNLTWRAGLTFAAERNEVVDLGGRGFIPTGDISGQGQSGAVSQRIMPGEPLGTFFGPVFAGVNAEGKQQFECTDASAGCENGITTNLPSADDYRILGNANPDFTLSVHSQANWGNFDLSFLVHTEVGGEVFNNTALVYSTKGNALQNKNFLVSALSDPTGLHEPAIPSSRWIEDRTFGRLQNVTVGYSFGLPGTGVRGARVYLSGDNLILLTGYSGYDPEVYTSAGLASRGIDYLTYPRPRTVTAGVRVSF